MQNRVRYCLAREDGYIRAVLDVADGEPLPEGAILIDESNPALSQIGPMSHYVSESGEVRPYSQEARSAHLRRPGAGWSWHARQARWIDQRPIEDRRREMFGLIDAERERRNQLPIQYAGSTFDADATAQRNVSAWMSNISVGVSPPDGFVWRDYDNVNHPADAAFVTGLGAAITLRGTALYQTAWAKKTEVSEMTAEQLEGYDPTANW